MHYPEHLKQAVLAKAKDLPLEGFVEGQGPQQPKVMLIGEAPGKEEIKENVPFIGRSGQLLMEQLQQVGLSRETVYIPSAVRSRPFSVKTKQIAKTGERVTKFPNRTPTKEEIKIFAPLLDWEIAVCQPELILTLGNIGLQRLLGPKPTITAVHGTVIQSPIQTFDEQSQNYHWTQKTYQIIPLFHPAAVFYNYRLKEVVKEDWQVVQKQLQLLKKV